MADTPGGEYVDDKHSGSDLALSKLRRRLSDGLARAQLSQTQLASRTGVSRGTVWGALSPKGGVPSAETVAALANTLLLDSEELLDLRREAAGESDVGDRNTPGPGRPIGEWDPHALEVHPAGPGTMPGGTRELPAYVERAHDSVLSKVVRDAAEGRSRMVVLVGDSSTGKTRACWEAVQRLADDGWLLWHPVDPTRAEAALNDLHRIGPRTVVWLNEAQHYLGDQKAGERIAAALHTLLTVPERGPVLVMGTLWPEFADRYAALPWSGKKDRHSRVRELLSGRTLSVPDTFDTQALAEAAAKAQDGDRLLADALTRATADGRVAQELAGAPELLKRYEQAKPPARAVLDAAMDARRLGVGLHLPQAFLTEAVADYLTDNEYDQLTGDWAERTFAYLTQLVHGQQAPLRRASPRHPLTPVTTAGMTGWLSVGPVFRLADYLEQHGDTARGHLCPPASFWHAAHTHLVAPQDLDNLADAATRRHRLKWAYHLRKRAAERGDTGALYRLAEWQKETGDWEGGEALALQAVEHGSSECLLRLVWLRDEAGDREGVKALLRQAADRGDIDPIYQVAHSWDECGDLEGAESLYRQAADHGKTGAQYHLARLQEKRGDREGAERLYRQAAERGDTNALYRLAEWREEAGDQQGAAALVWQAVNYGAADAPADLAQLREEAGDREGIEALARQAVDHGDAEALYRLAQRREEAGDREGAEGLYRQAADRGDAASLYHLILLREKVGDREGIEDLVRQAADRSDADAISRVAEALEKHEYGESAERLYRQAADHGSTVALAGLARFREKTGDRESAEALAWQAVDRGSTVALTALGWSRMEVGDRKSAEDLFRQAVDRGDSDDRALYHLIRLREEAGDRVGADRLYQLAADRGDTRSAEHLFNIQYSFAGRWPYGLEPDGSPTPKWQP